MPMEKSSDAFRTISEVAEDLDLPQHVLRFWETRFNQIRPLKRGGGRRYYRPDDVELLRAIRHFLYGEGYTIKGVQKILKEQGARALIVLRSDLATQKPVDPSLFDQLAPKLRQLGDKPAAEPEGEAGVAVEPHGFDELNAPAAGLGRAEFDRLKAALAEIVECERLLLNALRHEG
jgi:DNA-binding transcriptional MerR regulator